ncbi:hypothetical protein JTE90_021145 [Oedothorax gibbosus]|uniref:Growth hormone receptor n=1 Tax=Oedothorax gibbosus TaxID=931172 RepID=A0AAV6U1L9_9ARAC|nr:hypothetical protein JTE90_021145 [Oedothorax gibbosus]
MSPALSPPEEICEIPCSSTLIDHANKFGHDLYSSTPNVHKDSSINEDELCHSFLTSHSDEPYPTTGSHQADGHSTTEVPPDNPDVPTSHCAAAGPSTATNDVPTCHHTSAAAALLLLSTSNAAATYLPSQQVGTTSDCIDKGIQAIPDFANAKINTVFSISSQILTNDDYSSDTDSGSDDSDSEREPYPTDKESDYHLEEDFSEEHLQMRNLMFYAPALSSPEEICEITCSSTLIDHANKFGHGLYSSTPNVHKDSSINKDELCHSFLTSHSDEPCNVSCPDTADSRCFFFLNDLFVVTHLFSKLTTGPAISVT